MLENRLRELFAQPASAAVVAAPAPAFVPCPVFLAGYPARLSFVAEVYRVKRNLLDRLRFAGSPAADALNLLRAGRLQFPAAALNNSPRNGGSRA